MTQYACQSFATAAQLIAFGCSCGLDATIDATEIDAALAMASDVMCLLSGGRVTGICTRTVYPIGGGGGCFLPTWRTYPGNSGGYTDEFGGLDVIPLRGPNTVINSITIAGVILDPGAYRLVNGTYLLRIDGSAWPTGNNFDPNSATAWTINYSFNPAPDKISRDAACEFACELLKDYKGRKSNLAMGITNLNLQGVSATVEDMADAMREGHENMPAVARFLGVYNPNDIRETIGVWSPELERGWNLVTLT